ncbi:MAG: PQQ-binding-like beta-propeller repeat protein [Acidobacteria bacterium]|nr:PQQ-binding-like beta-propeller repeat protein [Acidobacteriota bacterium]MYH27654.1 PQQ-binding-like beta-propeller repeat protein [Acidobacteriota bacterium]
MRALLLRALAAVVVLAVFAAGVVGFLVVAFDMQVEFAGSGMRPLFSFGTPDAHYAALEADRDNTTDIPSGADDDDAQATGIAPEASRHDAYWTDFRGPHRDGIYSETAIRTDWPTTGLEPLWSQPVGGGYASFVVADGLAFTIEQRRDQEVVAAYDVATGVEAWTYAWSAHFRETMGGPGPRATPTWHDGRLYALGATGRFVCLDAATGAVVWERNILTDADAPNLPWAMSGAPLIVDDLVIVQPGGTRGWSIAAYDRLTGEVVWHGLDDVQSYTSPMVATLDGVRQIVVVTAERAAGLLPEDGTLLWEYAWTVRVVPNIAQPLVTSDTRIFLSAGYGKGAALVELTRTGDRFVAETVWETNRMKNKFSSSVLIDGYIYGLDRAILACIDAATGELMWKGGRYGFGQLLAAGDHLVVLTERGDLVLVRATPDGHDEIAGFRAIEGKTWNVPAMAGGRILVRNARQMAAFDLSP